MNELTRRRLIETLAALGALAATGAQAQEAAEAIAGAWRSQGSGKTPDHLNRVPLRGLARRVRADFASGRTFNYGGWLLSDTEGQLCALVVQGSR